MKKLTGVNTPISCPMTPDQQVDYAGLEKLCDYLIEKGVDGIYPSGSTGEMAYLTLDERKKILETVLKTVAGRVNVFCMVGANTTRDTIELARHAEKVGADGIGVVTPYYFTLDDTELENYFVQTAQSVSPDFPVYLYGIPQLAVNDITPQLAESVALKAKNVIGIKYSWPDMPRLIQFMNILDGKFSVICGPDDLFLATIASGGDGTISGNSNVIPEYFIAIRDAFRKGDLERARKLQLNANKLIAVISGPNNIVKYKTGLVHRGIIKSDTVRSPFRQLTKEEKTLYLQTLDKMDFTVPKV
ncbi:4-hydroxy-tetrahydrodipicolinate synthase [Spirochaetia bacterium]|nr:4-hydroxy-tetrahydrodipicolinate synthase [Spirochaetia bacterium]